MDNKQTYRRVYFSGNGKAFHAEMKDKKEDIRIFSLKVVTNEKGEAVGEVLTIIC